MGAFLSSARAVWRRLCGDLLWILTAGRLDPGEFDSAASRAGRLRAVPGGGIGGMAGMGCPIGLGIGVDPLWVDGVALCCRLLG